MTTLKFEIPEGNESALNRIGQALQLMAGDIDPSLANETTSRVTTTIEPTKQDNAFAAIVNNGPFYWSHPESSSTGAVTTRQELLSILNSDPLTVEVTEDEHNHLCEEGYDATNAKPLGNLAGNEMASSGNGDITPEALKGDGAIVNASNLDSDGLPWDARIHSSAKTQNKDLTWKVQRKPKDKEPGEWAALIGLVRTELRELMAVPVTGASETLPPTQTLPPPATEQVTFGQLMKFITGNRTVLTKDVVDAVLLDHGIDKLPLLAKRAELIPQIHADLGAML